LGAPRTGQARIGQAGDGAHLIAVAGPEEERARTRARSIGVLYQQVNLVGHLSVADNIIVPIREHAKLEEGLMREIAALQERREAAASHPTGTTPEPGKPRRLKSVA